ncbi:MAG TPA: HD domain-containing phosphohydrolase [Gemmatimonadales bacterium]|nr:HD domain-containing phosphohydrolase [Gemmatimonadales bacterium]
MTAPAPRLLLVDTDAARRQERQFALESNHGYAVIGVDSVRAARDRLESDDIQLVLTSASLGESDAIALLRRVGHDTSMAPSVIVLANADEHGLRRLAWTEGAVSVLTEPIDAGELGAAIRRVLGLRHGRLHAVHAEQELAASLDHLTDVVVLVLDAAVPGSAHRGADLMRLVNVLATGFTMEANFSDDLQRAARLHEIGRFTLGEEESPVAGTSAAGRCTMASSRLLAQVPALAGVAELIEGIGANWDGSGMPSGMQRGQIPLRSRLLRVGVDLIAAIERNARDGDPSLVAAVESLRPQNGRWYDPAVFAALVDMAAEEHPPEWQDTTAQVGLAQLQVGMRLAADLHTVSGVNLLSKGTVITATTLQLIRRRHELDPLVLPASIHQRWS